MKALATACALSVLANVALGVWIYRKDPGVMRGRNSKLGLSANDPAGMRAPKTDRSAALSAKQWDSLVTEDLSSSVARLRSAGFPPNVVRAIIAAQVDEQFRGKIRELISSQKQVPYWKKGVGWNAEDMKFNWAVSDLRRQEKDLVTALAGPDPDPDPTLDNWNQQRFGNMSPEKQQKIQDVESDYSRMQQEIYTRSNGSVILPSDQKELAFLEQQKAEDLAKVMSPEELADYQMKNSSTAMNLRYKLTAFDASEDEYKAIFQIQQAADQQNQNLRQNGPMTPDQVQQLQASQKQVDDQIASALGPDRFAQYKQDTDKNFLSVYRITSRLNLPTDSASQVVAIQQDISKQAQAIRQNPSLAASDRDAQLTLLYQTANNRVSGILGSEGAAAYMQTGGSWLQYNPSRQGGGH